MPPALLPLPPVGAAAVGQALNNRIKGWLKEVGDGIALSAGGIDDTVQRRLEQAVGPPATGRREGTCYDWD